MWKQLILASVLAFLVPKIYKVVKFQGYHIHTYNQRPGPCRVLSNVVNGSEDIQLLPSGKVLITSGVRLLDTPNFEGVVGRVYEFDMNQPEKNPTEVIIEGDFDLDTFNPIGLSAWFEDTDIFIYIINMIHPAKSVVEIFQYNEEKAVLRHTETIKDSNFFMLNNLIVTGRRQFYFTNFLNTWGEWEVILMLYRGNAGFYNGHSSRIAADGMLMANGIAMSPDDKYVYISHIFDKEVRVYERHSDNSLTFKQAVQLYMCPDNLYVDQTSGDLWIAGSPVPHTTRAYLENPKHVLAQSKVLRLTMKDGSMTSLEQVLSDDGRLISGSSVALYRNNQLVIGAVSTAPVYCELKYIM